MVVEMGMPIPGIKSFSKRRNDNLKTQLAGYLETSILDEYSATPFFKLQQNYPNPFNQNTKIFFSLSRDANVKLVIFNIIGQHGATLVTGRLQAGQHQYLWQAINFHAGIYFCSMQTDSNRKKIKMLLLK